MKRSSSGLDDSDNVIGQGETLAGLVSGVRDMVRGTSEVLTSAASQIIDRANILDGASVNRTVNNIGTGALSNPARIDLGKTSIAAKKTGRTTGGSGSGTGVSGAGSTGTTASAISLREEIRRFSEANQTQQAATTAGTTPGRQPNDQGSVDLNNAIREVERQQSDPLGIAPIAARVQQLNEKAEAGDISDNDPRIDQAVGDLRRQIAKHTPDAAVTAVLVDILAGKTGQQAIADRVPDGPDMPDWSRPHLLSDADLIASVDGWPGTDNDPILDGLIGEFENRAEPEGGWITLGQHRLITDDFTARANGLEETLEVFDGVGAELVDELTEAGFDDAIARDIAAHLRAQFPGDEIALQAGLEAALAQLEDDFDTPFPQTDVIDFDRFDETVATGGGDAVIGFNRDFLEVSRSAIGTAAGQSGHAVTDEGVAQIMAYAVRNGVTVSAAARQFFGVDPDRPPEGVTRQEVLDPEVVEFEIRIVQEEATIDALKSLQDVDPVSAVIAALPGIRQMDDFDGDGFADYTTYADGNWGPGGGNSGTTELDNIVELVTAVTSIATDERIANQVGFTEHLKDGQHAVAVSAQGQELDFLDADQVELIERIESFGREINGLMLPFSADGVAELQALLDELDAFPDDHGYSPEFLVAIRELLDDPELVELLAFTGSNDLHEVPFDLRNIDLSRVDGLDDRVALTQILGPYAGDIDTNHDGVTLPKDLEGFIRTAQEKPDLAIPRRVIEAAQAALAEGYTDRSILGDIHIMLDIIGATEIPIVSQLADATNAGLYLVVDQDKVNAGISAIGLVATGTIALRTGTRGVRQFQASAEVLEALAKEGDDLIDIGAVLTRADGLIDEVGFVYVNGDVAAGSLTPIVRGTKNGKTVVVVDIGNGPEILRAGSGSLTLPSGETIQVAANGRVMHFSGGTQVSGGNATNNAFARVFGPDAGAGLQRPYIQNGTLDDIIAETPVDGDGFVLVSDAPGAPRMRDLDGSLVNINDRGSFHIGHVSGSEHRRLVAAAHELGLTQAQLNSFVNAHPGGLQIEGPLRNMSHVDELPGTGNLRQILDDMRGFFEL